MRELNGKEIDQISGGKVREDTYYQLGNSNNYKTQPTGNNDEPTTIRTVGIPAGGPNAGG